MRYIRAYMYSLKPEYFDSDEMEYDDDHFIVDIIYNYVDDAAVTASSYLNELKMRSEICRFLCFNAPNVAKWWKNLFCRKKIRLLSARNVKQLW